VLPGFEILTDTEKKIIQGNLLAQRFESLAAIHQAHMTVTNLWGNIKQFCIIFL
jgi:hypothetical protein